MKTENLSMNLGIIAAGLLIVNLALDLYDRFSRKNENDGQSKNEDAQPENDTQESNEDEKEDDDES